MPVYEYYCQPCDRVVEALRFMRDSDQSVLCPACGGEADRIMPTTFASMSFRQGYAQRVPYHHGSLRADDQKRTIALVKSKGGAKPKDAPGRSGKPGRGEK